MSKKRNMQTALCAPEMAESSSAGPPHLVDDFYFSALSHGRNDDHNGGGDELFPISDEKYAVELQLQEVIMSSVVAATAHPSLPPPLHQVRAKAIVSVFVKGECSSSTTSASASIAATLLFCKICMETVPESDARRAGRGCPHAFCSACLAGYIGAKIQDRIAGVKCPEEHCAGNLDLELCQGILPKEVFDRWDAALCESMLLGARRAYCPFKDCSAMMVADDGDDGTAVAEAECPSCWRLFCARCAVPWHAGVTCDEYGKLGERDRGRDDLMMLEMAKGKNWKRCPKCMFFVERSQGCLHITCRCGFEFCYGCGKQWGVTHASCSTA